MEPARRIRHAPVKAPASGKVNYLPATHRKVHRTLPARPKGKFLPRPVAKRGKVIETITVERKGVTATIDHYSNGHQQWGVVTFIRKGRKPFQVKMSPARLQNWLKRANKMNTGEKGLLASAALQVAGNPGMFGHAMNFGKGMGGDLAHELLNFL